MLKYVTNSNIILIYFISTYLFELQNFLIIALNKEKKVLFILLYVITRIYLVLINSKNRNPEFMIF